MSVQIGTWDRHIKDITYSHIIQVWELISWCYITRNHAFCVIYPTRRLIVSSRKVSDSRDLYWELYGQCCRGACQFPKWCHNSNSQSCCFETSRSYDKTPYLILKQGPAVNQGVVAGCALLRPVLINTILWRDSWSPIKDLAPHSNSITVIYRLQARERARCAQRYH